MNKNYSFSKKLSITSFLIMMMLFGQSASAKLGYTVLRGTSGYPGNYGFNTMFDGDVYTKWCSASVHDGYDGGWWGIFRVSEPFCPTSYTVTTADDANYHPERNWKAWKIYGANFSSDDDAQKDASEWVLLDNKQDIGLDKIPAASFVPVTFDMTEFNTAEFKYFMIYVTDIQEKDFDGGGDKQQMCEFSFVEPQAHEPVTYQPLDGTKSGWGDAYSYTSMLDGNRNTYWCSADTHEGYDNGWWIVFKSSEPVTPIYYELLMTGLQGHFERNWKRWNIYAANFDSDELATKNAEGWVLIDEKDDFDGTMFPNVNDALTRFSLSKDVTDVYSYFKIEIPEIRSGGTLQMSEFNFGFSWDLEDLIHTSYVQYADYITENAQRSLMDAYKAKLEELKAVTNLDMLSEKEAELAAMKGDVVANINAYQNYLNSVEYGNHVLELYSTLLTPEGKATLTSYLNDSVEPGATFPNGSYPYIMANCLLSTEEIQAETIYLDNMTQNAIIKEDEEPIDVTYQALAGMGNIGSLVDGDDYTVWSASSNADDVLYGLEKGFWTIFKTSEPIKPTLYALTTGNQTHLGNWTRWEIYGGNFNEEEVGAYSSEEWAAVKDGWVLIDSKSNIGPDELSRSYFTTCYLNLSELLLEPYQYFKVVVKSVVDGTLAQMGEFKFGNDATLSGDHERYYNECAEFNLDVIAQKSLIEQYETYLAQLKDCENAAQTASLYKALKSLQTSINSSVEAYTKYQESVDAVRAYMDENSDLTGFHATKIRTYLDEYVEPNDVYRFGSYQYIIQNRVLDASQAKTAAREIEGMLEDLMRNGYVVVSGTPDWNNDQAYNKSKLFDGEARSKWFMDLSMCDNSAMIIFKSDIALQPAMYTLTTGDDTRQYSSRNWKNWKIYGANFENDEAAVSDAEEWTLIDQREDVGADRLYADNMVDCYFGLTEEVAEQYHYFKLEITEAVSGNHIQMSELKFGNEEDVVAFRSSKLAEIELDLNIDAQISLLDEYEGLLSELEESTDVEEIITLISKILSLKQDILSSEQQYKAFMGKKEEILAYLSQNALVCDECEILKAYLNDKIEPNETYVNGSFAYILENLALGNEELEKEIAYMSNMLDLSIKKGCIAGFDITPLVANADFSNGMNGWDNTGFGVNGVKDLFPVASCRTSGKAKMSQTLTGLKNGIYKVRMNGLFTDENDYEACSYGAKLFAGGCNVPLMMVSEDAIDENNAIDLENCYITEADQSPYDMTLGVGYVPTSANGCSYAFNANRYENTILVNVTNGELTFGVDVIGIGGGKNCSTYVGNFQLTYCGSAEEAQNDIAATLQGQKSRAEFVTAYEVHTGDDFVEYPSYSNDIRNELKAMIDGADSSMASIEKYSNLFNQLTDCKFAYYAYIQAISEFENIVFNGTDYPFTAEQKEQFASLSATISDNIVEGVYTTEQALAQEDLKNGESYIAYYGIEPELIDGVYQIGTYDEWRWFVAQVNRGNGKVDVALKNDLDMSSVQTWIPVGMSDKPFSGIFDGKGYTIKNFNVNATSGNAGLFGYTSKATISNFSITGSLVCSSPVNGVIASAEECVIQGINSSLHIDATAAGITHTAGIVGELQKNSTISCCSFDGTLNIGADNYDCFGGIVGYTNTGTITNCASYGSITFANKDCYVGNMFGYVNNAKFGGFQNCLGVGTVKFDGVSEVAGALCGWLRTYDAEKIANNYWLAGIAERACGLAELECNVSVTAEQLASGAICYALNKGQDKPVWYQTIGVDPYPVLDPTHGKVAFVDGNYVNEGDGIMTVESGNRQHDMYNLSGMRVQNVKRGLYIIDGKKSVVR